jgi:ABC-type sugar transport system ATPase subunit
METMTQQDEIIIKLSSIYKKFGAIKALDDVSFELKKGEIHGLVGENGAGKTTLMSILHGTVRGDRGDIFIKGKYYKSMNPSIAKEIGIAIIPQKIQLFPQLSVAENVFINNWPKNHRNRLINWAKMRAMSEQVLEKVELNIDPFKKVNELSYVEQQMLEIARVFFVERVEIIILDEPTGPLAIHEVDILFNFVKSMRKKGVSFIYISHYLDEIFKICDRVTTLRDGRVVSVKNIESLDMKFLVNEMVGEGVDLYPSRKQEIGDTILDVRNFTIDPILKNVSFILKKGEILGIAGLKGSGRTELLRAICGLDKYSGGEIYLNLTFFII